MKKLGEKVKQQQEKVGEKVFHFSPIIVFHLIPGTWVIIKFGYFLFLGLGTVR